MSGRRKSRDARGPSSGACPPAVREWLEDHRTFLELDPCGYWYGACSCGWTSPRCGAPVDAHADTLLHLLDPAHPIVPDTSFEDACRHYLMHARKTQEEVLFELLTGRKRAGP